ncbi:MAG: hypothetical protein ACE5EQ_11560 [Phycisphaerae bacterium]
MNVQKAQIFDVNGALGLSAVTHSCIQDDPGDPSIPFNDGSNNNIDDDPVLSIRPVTTTA